VHEESGQGAVEWVALVLLAALVLGAGAAFAARQSDRGLGELVAERIARAPGEVASARTPGPAGPGSVTDAPAPTSRASAPAGATSGAVVSRGLRGVGEVARHAWILCFGYHRWRYERDNPIAAIEGLPIGEALGVVNDCLNPHDYLLED
jgi:hypothetical protein